MKTLNYNQYRFKATVWLYQGEGAWHFISLPKDLSVEIKNAFGGIKRGWGSMPVMITIGKTEWKSSIFPDSKTSTYLLPIKKSVRKAENITQGSDVELLIEILG